MPKVAEIVSKETLHHFYGPAIEALAELGASGEKRNLQENFKFGLNRHVESHQQLSEPILRYIHATMFYKARPESNLPAPYTRVLKDVSLNNFVSQSFDGFLTPLQANYLLQSVMKTFTKYNLAWRPEPRVHRILMAPWPPDLRIRIAGPSKGEHHLTSKDEWMMDTSLQRETSKPEAKFVHVTYDLSLIDPPRSSDPESIILYVKKLVEVFEALKQEHDGLKDLYKEVLQSKSELEDRLKSLQTGPEWEGVADQIAKIVKGRN